MALHKLLLESVMRPRYHPYICITFEPLKTVLSQTYSNAAPAMRFGAAGACAAAPGFWRMSLIAVSMSQPQNVINGKSRAHRVV